MLLRNALFLCEHKDEQAQLRRNLGLAALLLDQVLREADAFGHDDQMNKKEGSVGRRRLSPAGRGSRSRAHRTEGIYKFRDSCKTSFIKKF